MTVPSFGPLDARIMIIGEAPGETEVARGRPFVGYSGELLTSMLAEAGINIGDCYVCNVCRERPPKNEISTWMPEAKRAQSELGATPDGVECRDRIVHRHISDGLATLEKEIDLVRPSLILLLGNTPMWAVLGHTGVGSWRGSTLTVNRSWGSCCVVPTYHPAAVLRDWKLRNIVVQDLRRAEDTLRNGIRKPVWNFTVRPGLWQVTTALRRLLELADTQPLTIANDIETRAGYMTCMGFAWTTTDAICIPFVSKDRPEGYWTLAEEAQIVYAIYRLLTHPNVTVVGQNYIYDAQYIHRDWHFRPARVRDTMLAHHVCFPRVSKSLDFIASMYCDYYVYWKDDGKDWRGDGDEERYWRYNCEDCIRTLECDTALQSLVDHKGLREQHDFQMKMWTPVLKMMIKGVKVDKARYTRMRKELLEYAELCQKEVDLMVGYPINPRSPAQMQRFFYEELGLPKQLKRGTGKGTFAVSCDDEALSNLAAKEPLVRPIVERIAAYRSCQTIASNALKTGALGPDGRMRSSFNIAGTYTFRLSSAEDAFGSGLNLENITKGEEDA
jgi:uracil-DNA glycosylase